MNVNHLNDRLIVALDKSSIDEIRQMVQELSQYLSFFKVGLEAMTALGCPLLVDTIHQANGRVFLDGKFCDIPNTVGKA